MGIAHVALEFEGCSGLVQIQQQLVKQVNGCLPGSLSVCYLLFSDVTEDSLFRPLVFRFRTVNKVTGSDLFAFVFSSCDVICPLISLVDF